MIGWMRELAGSFSGALVFLAVVCVVAALVALRLGSIMRHLLTASAPGHPGRTDPETAR